ncbi:MAG TPA: hypothetical protein VN449_04425 [Gaiellaceae bacterium]|nr:hypothetical protein [Gaiellaceae bacterium]
MTAIVFPRQPAGRPVFDGLAWATMGYVTIVALPDLIDEFDRGLRTLTARIARIDQPGPDRRPPSVTAVAA